MFNSGSNFDLVGFLAGCGCSARAHSREMHHFAKIALSTMLSDVRKKAGSVVHQAGRMGLVVRKHSIPRQPRTSSQRTIRGNFGTNAKDWTTALSQTDRDGWTAFAATLTITDRLGRKFVPTGIQLYQRVQRNMHSIGLVFGTTPPSDQNIGSPITVVVDSHSVPGTITVNVGTPLTGTEFFLVYGGPQVSAGKSVPGKTLRLLNYNSLPMVLPWDFTASYVAKFGALATGKKVFVGVKYVDSANGAASGLVTSSDINA